MIGRRRSKQLGGALILLVPLLAGCHTFEVRQFESVKQDNSVDLRRAAVIMNPNAGDRGKDHDTSLSDQLTMRFQKHRNKLFSEQLIVSLQKRGIDVAERQKVEDLLVDAELIKRGMADLSETERAKRLGRLLKVDLIVYADAFVNTSYYHYFSRFFFNNNTERYQLQREANENGIVRRKGYPVLASHAIGLSVRAVDTATGEIVWVGYRFMTAANWVEDDRPETLTNFDVVRGVCDQIINDLLVIRKS